MGKDVNSSSNEEAGALEREAKAAKEEMERLVQAFAALPADVRATIGARIGSERSRLEAISAQADRALDDQRVELAAQLALLERQLQEQVDQLEPTRIEASRAQAEAAYEARRFQLENARSYATDGIDLSVETLGRHSRALDAGS